MNSAPKLNTFQHLIGEHQTFLEAKRIAKQFSLSELPVLITGKIGTGKNHFAHAIHLESSRSNEPFISVNCSTHSEETLIHELLALTETQVFFKKRYEEPFFLMMYGACLLLYKLSC